MPAQTDAIIGEQIRKYWEEKLRKDRNENDRIPSLGGFRMKRMMKLQMLLN